MTSKKFLSQILAASLLLSQNGALAETVPPVASPQLPSRKPNSQTVRPPQYVLLAFDGSYTLPIWKELRTMSKTYIATNAKLRNYSEEPVDMKFTFFINPIYVVHRGIPHAYTAPAPYHGSAIGFGDSSEDDDLRVQQMTLAHKEGHEIANHAVGHWDGSVWDDKAWRSEFDQFYSIMDNVFSLNKIPPFPAGVKRPIFMENQVSKVDGSVERGLVGFRAPQLGWSKGLYKIMPEYGIKYDTSQITEKGMMDYWPNKRADGLWNIPLVSIPIPGEARFYPTMDYNFCANDSIFLVREHPELIEYKGIDPTSGKTKGNRSGTDKNGKPIATDCLNVVPPEIKDQMQKRMFGAYMNYFNHNYYGKRAPITIGHHFSKWMGGAYYDAMIQTAKTVCNLPEVQCVTHREYMHVLEELDQKHPEQLALFRAGDFDKLPAPKAVRFELPLDLSANLTLQNEKLKLAFSGRDAGMTMKTKYYVNNKEVPTSDFSLAKARAVTPAGQDAQLGVAIFDRHGKELLTVTHRFENVGTPKEFFNPESLEEHFRKGDPAEAHRGEAP